MVFGFWLLAASAFSLYFFNHSVSENLLLLRSVQILFIAAILVYATGIIKRWHIFLFDKDNNVLAVFKQTHRNHDTVLQVTEMLKRKSEDVREFSAADPFPETRPEFEITYYDFSETHKTTDRFYQNEVIGFQKSWFTDKVYSVVYGTLSEKIYKGKIGINIWGQLLTSTIFIFSVIIGVNLGFYKLPRTIFLFSTYIVGAAFIIAWLLTFVKRDVIGFYNKNGNVAYYAYVNWADTEKFEKIMEFVQSRIPAENKESSLKE
jgi:hypothetical protein